jgi:hypothetical protein
MQAELVGRARDGDSDAFASLVSSSIDGCYALAYQILRDPHRAQDAPTTYPIVRSRRGFNTVMVSISASETPAARRRGRKVSARYV